MSRKKAKAAKLKARIDAWEQQKGSKVNPKDREHVESGFYMRKPGSNKK